MQALLPRGAAWLAGVFPVLRGVPAIERTPAPAGPIADAQEIRRRAFAALRDLLARLGDRAPLVLHVDDAQWGDWDSAMLLAEVLRPPDPPALLLALSYRSEDAAGSPLLAGLREAQARFGGEVEHREVRVGPLGDAEGRRLAASLLGRDADAAEAVAREARGNPFFLRELAQHVASGARLETGERLTLEGVLLGRVRNLRPAARRLLEVVAVSGVPVGEVPACTAAGVAEEGAGSVTTLVAGRLARTLAAVRERLLDTYHDRVRETVVANLGPEETRAHHAALARSLEAQGDADPELLGTHHLQAGDRARAGALFLEAADRAAAAFAFDRASRLYAESLDLLVPSGDARRAVLRRRADALCNARRGAEAAPVYLEAAVGASEAEAIELRCRAANQWLVSGRIDEWSRHAAPMLRAMRLGSPRSPARVLASLLWRRLRLRLRGGGFRERTAAEIAPRDLTRIDLVYATSVPLAYVDPVWAMELSARHVQLALRAGEPFRVCRALAGEAASSSSGGSRTSARTWKTWRTARALAERLGSPEGLGITSLMAGWATFCEGRWREALRHVDEAETVLRERCSGVAWELNTAAFYRLRSLEALGEIGEVVARLPPALEDAEGRNDLYAVTNLRTRIAYLSSLAADDPDGAGREIGRGIASWPPRPVKIQHFYEVQARADVALYAGDPETAWRLVTERWKPMKRAHFLRVQVVRMSLVALRGRAAVALAGAAPPGSPERRRFLASARGDAGRLVREGVAWCVPHGELLAATVADLEGDASDVVAERLRRAEAGFRQADMALHAAVARRRLGEVEGASGGRAAIESADEEARRLGVKNPARWAGMYAPGLAG